MPRPSRQPRREEITEGAPDISAALRGWTFEPGEVNVRLIRGSDGKPKIQLRLDLGLLQMEISGRPDGKRPHRLSSELEYARRRLERYRATAGSDRGFELTPRQCAALRDESAMFYHRYLSFFVLEQYDAVLRDTQHNLDVLDICRKYGRHEFDRGVLEQYRPYLIMMHTRARACAALSSGYVHTALAYLRGGLRRITRLVPRGQRENMLKHSSEGQILRDMIRQLEAQLPTDPRLQLRAQIRTAIQAEHYEEAAVLRDELAVLERTTAQALRKLRRPESRRKGQGARSKKEQ